MSAPRWGAQRAVTGEEIRQMAGDLNMSIAQFARALGLSRRALSYYMSGERPIPGYMGLLLDLLSDHRIKLGLMPHRQGAFQRRVEAARGNPPWWQSPDPGSHPGLRAQAQSETEH